MLIPLTSATFGATPLDSLGYPLLGAVTSSTDLATLPDNTTVMDDGTVVFPDGRIAEATVDGVTLPDGTVVLPNGAVQLPNGDIVAIDQTNIVLPDGSAILPDATVKLQDGTIIALSIEGVTLPDACVVTGEGVIINGQTVVSDATGVTLPDGNVVALGAPEIALYTQITDIPTGSIITTGGNIVLTDGSIITSFGTPIPPQPAGSVVTTGGNVVLPDAGGIVIPDTTSTAMGADANGGPSLGSIITLPTVGSLVTPNGDVVHASSITLVAGIGVTASPGSVVTPSGYVIMPDKYVTYPDGTTVHMEPDQSETAPAIGSGSNVIFNTGIARVDVAYPTIDSVISYPVDTDLIVIVGFFDSSDSVGELIPVASLQHGIASCKALDEFNRPTSNTAKLLISTWEAGGRSIALYRAGDPSQLENLTDEQRFSVIYDAYELAYQELTAYEFIDYLIPADVCFEDSSNERWFHQQLATWCAHFYGESESIIQGVMSTRSEDPVSAMLSPAMSYKIYYQTTECRLNGVWFPEADPYRFVSVAAGRGLHYSPQTNASFECGLAGSLAGVSASQKTDVSAMGRRINNISLKHIVSRSEAEELTKRGFIPFGLTVDARRGRSVEITILSDNNLAIPTSDLQQNQLVRFIRRVSHQLVRTVEPYVGSSGAGAETAVGDLLTSLSQNLIKSYSMQMARDKRDPSKLNFMIELVPYFTTKVISIGTSIGPIRNQ
jgi:hypothetical protein